MAQTIESYLVSLGFEVKQPQLDKFNQTLDNVGKVVEKNTSGVIGNLFKLQFALTSAFLAVGTGVVAMIDKVAMADQSYRLLGLQMFMSKNAAQSMDISLKALGATIDQVAWDPELHERFMQLQKDQRSMVAGLGGDFEKNMRSIRDLRFEWSRFTVELQYLSMGVVNDLFNKLGLGSGTLLDKLKQFNDYIVSHIPQISATINEVLVPALKDAWEILKDFGEIAKEAWVAFQQIVGILSGDSSLDGTETTLQSISTTLKHVTEDAHDFLMVMLNLEKSLAHFAIALVDIGTGHFGAAGQELAAGVASIGNAIKSFTPGGGAIFGGVAGALGGAGGGAAAGAAIGGALGLGILDPITIPAGALIGGFLGTGAGVAGGAALGKLNPFAGGSSAGSTGTPQDHLSAIAAAISAKTGIPAELLYGQLFHESGGGTNRGARDLHNYSGVKIAGQDKYRDFGSDEAYIAYLSRMFTDKKYSSTGLLAARNADEYASDLKKAGYYGDTVENYRRGIERNEGGYRAPGAGGGVTVNGPLVQVAGGSSMTPQQLTAAVQAGLRQAQQSQNVTAQANVTGVHQ